MLSDERIKEIEDSIYKQIVLSHCERFAFFIDELLNERRQLVAIANLIGEMKSRESWPEVILEVNLHALDELHKAWEGSKDE